MKCSAFKNFVCPVDGRSLLKKNNTFQCGKGHVFDVAREGYCNLLLVQQKASLDPGDSKEMVAARQRFLNDGHFARIAEHLFEIVRKMVKPGRSAPLRIVDAGCGEGYYLHQLSKLAAESGQSVNLELAGCDISKWAVKAAAKRSTEISWVVAGNRQLPFAPGSVDLLLSMFGFPVWESFKAVQSSGGRVLVVDPGMDHLIELRRIIYPEVNLSEARSLKTAADSGYTLEMEKQLKYSVSLENSASIQDLLAMTPHAFRITQKAREELQALKHLTVSVDVMFRVLRKGRPVRKS